MQAPNIVAADEQFNVAFIIEGEKAPSSFSWDPGSDFQLIWGPQKGSSSSISIVNGKTTRSSQTTYTYILQPKSIGKFTLPQAVATFKGDELRSKSFTVEVLSSGGGSAQGGGSSTQGSAPKSGSLATGDIDASDLFLRFSLSRREVVLGEPVTAVLKLYQRVNIAGFEDAKFPTFNGFWSQEVFAPTSIDFKRENVGGEIYDAAVLRSWVIIPQQTGTLEIDPSELVCVVNVRTNSTSRSIFDSFFDDGYRTIRKRLSSPGVSVKVQPLPPGAPSSFGGGVGKFTISASLSRDTLKTHEAASLELTLSGKGNVSLLEAPKLRLPLDFEAYDIKSTDRSDKSTGRTTGSKVFEYPFIPRSWGDFTIEPIEYSYYDVDAHKYVTLRTEPLHIYVEKGAETDAPAAGQGQILQGGNRRDVKDLGTDIRFIRTKKPSFDKSGSFFCGSPVFWGLLVLLLAAAVAAYFALQKAASRRADVVGVRHRKASSTARKRLAAAGTYLQKDLYTAFYEELHRALQGYAGDKLGIDVADMTKENISEHLVAAGAGEPLAAEFTALLDACEYARYAPDAGHGAMQTHYDTAMTVISSIEGALKAHKGRPGVKAAIVSVLLCTGTIAAAPDAFAAQGEAPAAEAGTDYPQSLWDQAVAEYTADNWQEAIGHWQAVLDLGLESSALYYNLGNAWFKAGDTARAILCYERALRLDPSDKDVRYNLEFARSYTQDHIDEVPEFFLKTWARRVSYLMGADAWAGICLLCFALALALALVFLLSRRSTARRLGFFGAIAALIISVMALSAALSQRKAYFRSDAAIVLRPVTSAKSSPGASLSSTDLFVLHEGTKVKVLDAVGDWMQVEIADGRQGWLPAADIEII